MYATLHRVELVVVMCALGAAAAVLPATTPAPAVPGPAHPQVGQPVTGGRTLPELPRRVA